MSASSEHAAAAGAAERWDEVCNCAAVRQAARHVTQLYDQHLMEAGLRTTQYSMLVRLARHGPMTINQLAAQMVMDRTTLARNLKPLERDGLLTVSIGRDRRSREVAITPEGVARAKAARRAWQAAQAGFEAAFGAERAKELRRLMRAVTTV